MTSRAVLALMSAVVLGGCITVGKTRAPLVVTEPEGFEARPCPEVPVLAGWSCAGTASAWVFGKDPQEVQRLAWTSYTAAKRFEHHFGHSPSPGIVVVSRNVDDAMRQGLRVPGAEWFIPVPSREDIRKMLEETDVPAFVDRDQLAQMADPAMMLPHELGHLWFIRMTDPDLDFWSSQPTEPQGYGGRLPDWLDEAAALLMEREEMVEERRSTFQADFAEGRIRRLAELVQMEHPADETEPSEKPKGESGGARVSISFAKRGSTNEVAAYYNQVRSFVDFLLVQTKEPTILKEIAAASMEGESFETWLTANAQRYGLPVTVEALEEQWKQHVRQAR